jgi:hypothetical protein
MGAPQPVEPVVCASGLVRVFLSNTQRPNGGCVPPCWEGTEGWECPPGRQCTGAWLMNDDGSVGASTQVCFLK